MVWVLNPKVLPSFIEHEPTQINESDLHLDAFYLARYIRAYAPGLQPEDSLRLENILGQVNIMRCQAYIIGQVGDKGGGNKVSLFKKPLLSDFWVRPNQVGKMTAGKR